MRRLQPQGCSSPKAGANAGSRPQGTTGVTRHTTIGCNGATGRGSLSSEISDQSNITVERKSVALGRADLSDVLTTRPFSVQWTNLWPLLGVAVTVCEVAAANGQLGSDSSYPERSRARPLNCYLSGMKSKLALGSAPAVSTPFLAAGVTSPTSILSVFLHHRPKRIDARGQAEPIEACRHLVPSFAHSPHTIQSVLC
jgi:hypothetical protein